MSCVVTTAAIQKEDAQQMKGVKEEIELEKLISPRSNWYHSKGIHHPLPPNSPFAGSFWPEKIDYRRIKGN